MPQLADPNSLRLVLIGWSLSRRTNQGAGRDAGLEGSLVYHTFSAWTRGAYPFVFILFLKHGL